MQVLWPNLEGVMLRLAHYVGGEIIEPGTSRKLLSQILSRVSAKFSVYEQKAAQGAHCLDREALQHYLRLVLKEASVVHRLDVRAGGDAWDPAMLGFVAWRQAAPGDLTVQDKDCGPDETMALRQTAEHLLGPWDWQMLGQEAELLWAPNKPRPRKQGRHRHVIV